MNRKSKDPIRSSVSAEVKAPTTSRQFRDRLTRVTSPIKGKVTNAKQWNRWTP